MNNVTVHSPAEIRRAVIRRVVQILLSTALIGAILFVSAGTLDWVWAWAYLGVTIGELLIAASALISRYPEVIMERAEAGGKAEPWDAAISYVIGVLMLAAYAVAGLDYRLEWTAVELPVWLHVVGLAAYVAGYAIVVWAMASNTFFSRVVRIQAERGHTVCTGGPYQFIRHPGYAGMILYFLATIPALGTIWALIPMILMTLGYGVRTVLEDRTLRERLPGYAEYAQRVKYRWIPGLW